MDVRDCYTILNLKYGASKDEVKNAYRQLAKRYHPDINPSTNARAKFIEINKAYETLSNLALDYFTPKTNGIRREEYLRNKKNYHDEEFHRRARERAKAKYEQMKQKQEDFKKSGIYDILLLLQYGLHYLIAVAAASLFFFPVYIILTQEEPAYIHLFFFWITGGILGYYIIVNKKKFFKIDPFYYTIPQLKKLIFKHPYTEKNYCYYCKNQIADALPYKVHLLRVKDVVIDNKGPLLHNVGYKRKNVAVVIPRSKKALIIHATSTFIRIFSIISALLFLPIDSLIWRFILGLILGTFFTFLLQFASGTKARNSYIFTFGFVTKILLWILILSLFSTFELHQFNIHSSEKIGVILVIMFLVDPIIESLLKFILKNNFHKALVKQPSKVEELLKNNFQYYLEISGWSMLYPIGKWIFG